MAGVAVRKRQLLLGIHLQPYPGSRKVQLPGPEEVASISKGVGFEPALYAVEVLQGKSISGFSN